MGSGKHSLTLNYNRQVESCCTASVLSSSPRFPKNTVENICGLSQPLHISVRQSFDPYDCISLSGTLVFSIPCAVAPNIQTLLICRFFCGVFASGPLTLAGSTISDIWDNNERGFAIALFAAAPYGGAALGPLVGVSPTSSHPQ